MATSQHTAHDTVGRAVQFLDEERLPWGELPTQIGARPSLTGLVRFDSVTTTTALAVPALRSVAAAAALVTSSRGFLARSRAPDGSWSYWPPRSPAHAEIDPDADDTALAAAALELGPDDAAADRLRAHRDRAGRYLTWLRRPGARNDVDVVVNAHVVTWLADPADPAWSYVATEVSEPGALPTGYYVHATYPLLAMARAARRLGRADDVRDALRTRILAERRADGTFGAAGATAAALSALELVGALEPDLAGPAVRSIRAARAADGGWPVEPLWRGPEPPAPPSMFWGSRALATAWCAEALTRVLAASW